MLKCYNKSSLGLELQTKAAYLQNEVLGRYPKDIPSIVVNRKPEDYLSRIALTDFRKSVCNLLHEQVDMKWDNKLTEYCITNK